MTWRGELTTAEVIYDHETDAAICVLVNPDDMRGIWIAKSRCTIDPTRPDRGDIVTLTGPEWLLIEKGLI